MEAIVVDTDEEYDPKRLQDELTFDEAKQLREFFDSEDEYHVPLVYIQLMRLADKKGVLLATLDVRSSERGKGIGSSIQERLADVVQKAGFEYIVGEAVDETALQFNLKNGYEILAEGSAILERMQRQGFVTEEDMADGRVPVIRYV